MDVLELIQSNPNIEIIELEIHSDKWYKFRMNGIGASEIGYVLRKSDWKDSLPVYEEKVGLKNVGFRMNEAMTHGANLESYIADMWRCYDAQGDDYWDNVNDGVLIRDCEIEPVKHKYFRNKKYPWLFCSLDGLMMPGTLRSDRTPIEKLGVLEIKNQRSMVLKKWILQLPPEQLYQIHQIMLILEADYGEICRLIDGQVLDVLPIPFMEHVADDLITESKKFWYNHVLPAKKIKAEIQEAYAKNNKDKATRLEAELFGYEPEPIGTRAYVDYLTESAKIESTPIPVSNKVYDAAIAIKAIDAIQKELNKKKDIYKAQILHHFRVKDGNEMDFGEMGKVMLKRRVGSENSTLYNYAKNLSLTSAQLEERAIMEANKIRI